MLGRGIHAAECVAISKSSVNRRRNLTPPTGQPTPGLPPTRRAAGARREVSDRVRFRQGEREISGWALNISRGGLRAIIEEQVELGAQFEVAVGDNPHRPGRIVWIQDEPDGAIVGVSFLDDPGETPPPPRPKDADSPRGGAIGSG
jgi:hypothetical protein